jgi:tetratricopeptide (TPR) repeat protein
MHRAEIKRLSGAWQDAIDEAQHAVERLTQSNNRKDTAGAWYQLAEVHRLRGDFEAAEQAYRSAVRPSPRSSRSQVRKTMTASGSGASSTSTRCAIIWAKAGTICGPTISIARRRRS